MDESHFRLMSALRPTARQRWLTWPASWWHRKKFDQLQAFVLFVGYPRTGHSLIGSLLNAHKHALLAHELNVMHFVKRGFDRNQICWHLWQQDQAFAQIGRNWTDYDYRVPDQWQGRWEELHFIGDKHANGATKVIGQKPETLDRLRDQMQVPVKLVHIVRHPLDTISTMFRRNRQGKTLFDCCDEFLGLCDVNQRLCETNQDSLLTIHLEDFIANPQRELLRLTGFVGMEVDLPYVQACCSIVKSSESRTRELVDWPPLILARITSRRKQYAFWKRYDSELARPQVALSRAA